MKKEKDSTKDAKTEFAEKNGDLKNGGLDKTIIVERGKGRNSRTKSKPREGVKKNKKIKVLFVCTGNTCRSAMAEQLFRHFLRGKKELSFFDVGSAGIYADEGAKMNAFAERALLVLGVKPKPHLSRKLTEAMVKNSDMLICMTAAHKAAIKDYSRAYSLGEATGGGDVPDPYGCDLDTYLAVARYLQYACKDIYCLLKN